MEKIIELKDIDHVVAGKNFISFQSQPSITGFDSVLILNPKEVLRAEDTTGQSILSHPPALEQCRACVLGGSARSGSHVSCEEPGN